MIFDICRSCSYGDGKDEVVRSVPSLATQYSSWLLLNTKPLLLQFLGCGQIGKVAANFNHYVRKSPLSALVVKFATAALFTKSTY
jgi:hypothetical protein